jgi:Na+/H+ antiporter NhaD/arsenite permease-like protein
MILGGVPGLAIDRTGVALLGAIVLVATGRVAPQQAWNAIDVPTMALLLGLMVVSAQLRLGGLYSAVTRRIADAEPRPLRLLALVVAISAALSALLANDIVCLAVAPLLIDACRRRGLAPLPFLLALACSANIGSAATLIGNPQNMLIGQTLDLSFAGYLLDGVPPALIGCALLWLILAMQFRDSWKQPARQGAGGGEAREKSDASATVAARPLDRWQAAKGLIVLSAVVALLLGGIWPREVVALAAAGVLLLSRRLHTREILALVDWHLLVLFAGLFVVHHGLASAGAVETGLTEAARSGVDLGRPAWLFGVTAVLSNLVSNVPAVMLLLPAARHPQAGAILALSSTLVGNLIIVGSIANIIVVDQAARLNVRISWRDHARTGVPVTVATLAVAAGWLWLRS